MIYKIKAIKQEEVVNIIDTKNDDNFIYDFGNTSKYLNVDDVNKLVGYYADSGQWFMLDSMKKCMLYIENGFFIHYEVELEPRIKRCEVDY